MSWKQQVDRKETLIGHTDLGRVIWPTLRSSNRRRDPDGGSTEPYYPALTGTNITIVIAGDVTAAYVVNFISDAYGAAITAINAISPANIKAEDDNGYLRITSLHPGNKNSLVIAGGTACTILGYEIFPIPGSSSFAGEIATTGTGWPTQNNDQLSRLVSHDEGLNSIGINRSISGIATMFDAIVTNMDREFSIPKKIDVTVTGGVFSVPLDNSLDRLFIAGSNENPIIVPNPGLDILDKVVTFLDTNDDQVFHDNVRVRVQNITYGPLVSGTVSFTSWNAADGKSVFGNSTHWNKVKTSGTIASIKGNVLTIFGALFVTRGVSPGDTVLISAATNNTPFNHNGDFVVEEVHDENHVSIRPKGLNDSVYDLVNLPPASLNINKLVGESYGTATVIVGKYLPFVLPDGAMSFKLNVIPPNGTYRILVSVGRTLRTLTASDIALSTVYQEFGKQIELGSKLATVDTDGLKPRIIATPNTTANFTLLLESLISGNRAARLYTRQNSSFFITMNAKWNGVAFEKDVSNQEAITLEIQVGGMFLRNKAPTDNVAWVDADLVASWPLYTGTNTSLNTLGNGIRIGTLLLDTTAKALIPRLSFPLTTIGGVSYILISQSDDGTNPAIRTYETNSGTRVTTFNAKWDGTDWIKDTASLSYKTEYSKSGNIEWKHSSNTTPFSDAVWTSKDYLRNFLFDEDFLAGAASATYAANTNLTSLFKVISKTRVDLELAKSTINYAHGNLVPYATTIAQSFDILIQSRTAFPIGIRDFLLKVRASITNLPILGTIVQTDTPGFFVGLRNVSTNIPPPFWDGQVGLVTGDDSANWKIRRGNSNVELDAGIVSTTMVDATFERINGVLYTYINGVLFNTVAMTDDIQEGYCHIHTTSGANTASANNQEIAKVDYVKLWLPRPF